MAELIKPETIDWSFDDAPIIQGPGANAEAAPAEQADTEPAVVEEQPEDTGSPESRPRDEQGRFVAQEQEQLFEPEPEDPVVAEYLARYGGDREAAVKAAAHQQSLLGRQGVELGQLRDELRQWQEQQEQLLQQPRTTLNLSDLYDEDPGAAADAALSSRDTGGYDRVMRQWQSEDPAGARQYLAVQQARYEAHLAREESRQLREQHMADRHGTAMQSAWTRLSAEIPDLESLRDAMTQEAQDAARVNGKGIYSEAIESGDPEQAYWAFRTLALAAQHRVTDVRRAQATELARDHAAETQRAKAEATVTSANVTAPEPSEEPSYDDEFLAEVKRSEIVKQGWEVGHY